MNKTELLKLSGELDDILRKIEEVSDEYPTLLIYNEDKTAYSFSMVTQLYRDKTDLFRRNLAKFAPLLIQEKRKKKRVNLG